MATRDFPQARRSVPTELDGTAAITAVAAMIGVLFAGSTVLTPLYIVYQQQFGFSKITLTLIYAAYVIGNLAALFIFGGISDTIGRRRAAVPAMAVAIIGALMFLFAQDTAALYIGRILSGFAVGVGAATGTAWLAELIAAEDKTRATIVATSTNFAGLGLGALLSGLLVEYAPWPLHLTFIVYLAALLGIGALIWFTRETIAHPAPAGLGSISLRPRLAVPENIRAQFVAPAVSGFGTMALVGFYAALTPSILASELHEANHAVAGALVFELSIIVSGTIIATQALASRTAMLWALGLMVPSVVLLVAAQLAGSMAIMIAATALCGVTGALGYRGSLQVVNQIAPQDQRAEVVSSYFVCCFCGNALPVIGIGLISTWGSANLASILFAAMIAVFAVAALVFGVRYTR